MSAPPDDLSIIAAAIFVRYLVVCSQCRVIAEYDEADELDRELAASWFRGKGWRVRKGKVMCSRCWKRRKRDGEKQVARMRK